MSYFVFFCYLSFVSCSGSIISVGEERAIFLLSCTCNDLYFKRVFLSLPLGAWDRLR